MKALALGGATVDIIASVADHEVERMTMHNAITSFLLLEEGKKIDAQSVEGHIGGGAVNASVSMARLGLDIACRVKIAQDREGAMVRERLEQEGVDTRWVIDNATLRTGCAVMVSAHVRNPTIFVARGANTQLREEEITPDLFAGRDLTYVTGLSGDSADCFPKIVRLAKEAGSLVVANPGIRQLSSRTQPFWDSLPFIDVLVMNEVEAGQLVPFLAAKSGPVGEDEGMDFGGDAPELLQKGLSMGGMTMPLDVYMARMMALGPQKVLVTNGKDGAYLGTPEAFYYCPTVETPVLGTAGAGDAFASTFAAMTAQGEDAETALRAAAVNAASVVAVSDTQSGLLSRAAIQERIAKGNWQAARVFKR